MSSMIVLYFIILFLLFSLKYKILTHILGGRIAILLIFVALWRSKVHNMGEGWRRYPAFHLLFLFHLRKNLQCVDYKQWLTLSYFLFFFIFKEEFFRDINIKGNDVH